MSTKKLVLICINFSLLIAASISLAAAIDPSLTTPAEQFRQRQFDSQEQARKQQVLKSLRDQQEVIPDTRNDLDAINKIPQRVATDIPDDEKPCFIINEIKLVGEDASNFQFALDQVLNEYKNIQDHSKSLLGSCLGLLGINAVIARVQNVIIEKGYVTTRVLVAPQDLKIGILNLSIIPGRVSSIKLTSDSDTLNAGAAINNTHASIESAVAAVSLTAAGAVNNTAGLIVANQNTTLNAASLNNADGQISGLDTSITTTNTLNNTRNALIVAQRDLSLTTGALNNESDIQATRDLVLNASDTITNSGTLFAQGNATLTTLGDLNNGGLMAAHGNAEIYANGASSKINSVATGVIAAGLSADGSLDTVAAGVDHMTGNLTISAMHSVSALGQNLSAGDQVITAQSLALSGSQTVGRNLTFMASNGNLNAANATIATSETLTASTTQTLTTDAAKVSAKQLNLTAHDLGNIAGELVQTGTGDTTISLAGDLNNTQGRIATNSNHLTLSAQTITNAGGSIEHVGTGKLDITSTTFNGSLGQVASNGDLDLTASTATLDNASTVAKHINVDTATLSNRGGEIIQTGTGATNIKATTQLDNTGGFIASNGNTTLTSGDLVNEGGAIEVSGKAAGTASLTINATGIIDNKALNGVTGSLQADGAMTLRAVSLNNMQGQITAGDTLQLTTTSNVNGIDNSQGRIAADGGVILNTGATINNTQASIESAAGGMARWAAALTTATVKPNPTTKA
jgi:filamentous hemagglutinin